MVMDITTPVSATSQRGRSAAQMSTLSTLLLLVLLFLPSLANAANHFVRQGATGSGSGADWSNAYTALPAPLGRGDTYYMAAGSYSGRAFSTPASGTTVITIKTATVADRGSRHGYWLVLSLC